MSWLLPTLVAFACFALVFYVKQRQFSHPAVQFPYALKPAPFSDAERELLALLEESFADRFVVLARVRVLDVLDVTALPRRSAWYHANNQVSGRRFDFLLCRRDTLQLACALALEEGGDEARDDFLPELCQRIGLPYVRLVPGQLQRYGAIRDDVERALT